MGFKKNCSDIDLVPLNITYPTWEPLQTDQNITYSNQKTLTL